VGDGRTDRLWATWYGSLKETCPGPNGMFRAYENLDQPPPFALTCPAIT
jgi:hypothetical protein